MALTFTDRAVRFPSSDARPAPFVLSPTCRAALAFLNRDPRAAFDALEASGHGLQWFPLVEWALRTGSTCDPILRAMMQEPWVGSMDGSGPVWAYYHVAYRWFQPFERASGDACDLWRALRVMPIDDLPAGGSNATRHIQRYRMTNLYPVQTSDALRIAQILSQTCTALGEE